MDSLEVFEEIIDQFDDEISDQEALEYVVDRSVTTIVFQRHYRSI